MNRRWVQISILWLFAESSWGVTIPNAYRNKPFPVDSTKRLRSLTISIDGDQKVVKSGERLILIRGQVLKIIGSSLENGLTPLNVNVVGFKNRSYKSPSNDLGFPVDSSTELLSRWSLNGQGKIYSIVAESPEVIHGVVEVELVEPLLKYLEFQVNGQPKLVRPGEGIYLKAEDKIKILNVVTNLKDSKRVDFKVRPIKPTSSKWQGRLPTHEVQLSIGKKIFAMVPLTVAGM